MQIKTVQTHNLSVKRKNNPTAGAHPGCQNCIRYNQILVTRNLFHVPRLAGLLAHTFRSSGLPGYIIHRINPDHLHITPPSRADSGILASYLCIQWRDRTGLSPVSLLSAAFLRHQSLYSVSFTDKLLLWLYHTGRKDSTDQYHIFPSPLTKTVLIAYNHQDITI